MKVLGRQEYTFGEDIGEPQFIIDAGANIGLSTLYFAWKYPSAEIAAVEPDASNFELLQRNCSDLRSVRMVHAALWNRTTQLCIVNPDSDNWSFSVEETRDPSKAIPSVTVSELLKDSGRDHVDILKLDIEGAEKQLFCDGWEEWLPRVRIIMIELHDRIVPGCSHSFYSAIRSRPFRQELMGENALIQFNPD